MSVTTKGLEALRGKMQARAAALNGEPLRVLVGAMAQDFVQRVFRRAASMTPGDVPDLKPGYRLEKQKRYGHAYPILNATGAMLKSMYAVVVRKGEAQWGIRLGFHGTHAGGISNAELAAVHIEGRGSAPARDFTRLPKGWETPWLQRINTLLKAASP